MAKKLDINLKIILIPVYQHKLTLKKQSAASIAPHTILKGNFDVYNQALGTSDNVDPVYQQR